MTAGSIAHATLQRHLAGSDGNAVELEPYLAQLCASIGASMIHDHEQLTLTTAVDPVLVDSDVSVSMGLVVTELVINALKHAFPGGRLGHVVVGYAAKSDGWILSVSDDGVGMNEDGAQSGGRTRNAHRPGARQAIGGGHSGRGRRAGNARIADAHDADRAAGRGERRGGKRGGVICPSIKKGNSVPWIIGFAPASDVSSA